MDGDKMFNVLGSSVATFLQQCSRAFFGTRSTLSTQLEHVPRKNDTLKCLKLKSDCRELK